MWVKISAWETDLDARRTRFAYGRCDKADRGKTVLETPADVDGGPVVLDQTLVRVYGWCQHGHDVGEGVEDSSQEVAAEVGEGSDVGPLGV